ncbi:hypothetical protein ACFPJ8_18820, partial [Streptomyces fildesensis]|uniref:hypothetical protein n=1 Tax=Streptomyces fildesensis TaxID=375757 RepID=UPI003616B571
SRPDTWTTTIICTGHASDAAAKPAPADATTNAEATTPTCGCSTSRVIGPGVSGVPVVPDSAIVPGHGGPFTSDDTAPR